MVEVMQIVAASFKSSHAHVAALRASNPAAGHRWPTPLPETPGHSRTSLVSLSWGPCSFLLGPGAQSLVFALPEPVSPVLGMFWQLCGAFNGDLFQEHLCHPQVCWSRAPIPVAGHCWPTYTGEAQTLKGKSGSVCGVSRYTQVLVWALWMSLEGLILNVILPLVPSCWGFSFDPGCGVYFFGGIQHSPVDVVQQWVGILEFLQEKMSFYSTRQF